MSEYCKGYGIVYSKNSLKEKIYKIMEEYNNFRDNLKSYPYNSELMCKNYLDIFDKLMKNRKEILKNRRFPKINFFTKLKYKLNLKFF